MYHFEHRTAKNKVRCKSFFFHTKMLHFEEKLEICWGKASFKQQLNTAIWNQRDHPHLAIAICCYAKLGNSKPKCWVILRVKVKIHQKLPSNEFNSTFTANIRAFTYWNPFKLSSNYATRQILIQVFFPITRLTIQTLCYLLVPCVAIFSGVPSKAKVFLGVASSSSRNDKKKLFFIAVREL